MVKIKGIAINSLAFMLTLLPFSIESGGGNEPINFPLSFINFSANRIDFSTNNLLNNQFSTYVENAVRGVEPLRILHIGDSHIQADIFTSETRKLFAWWLSDSSVCRGYTFPYGIAETNNPADYVVSGSKGWLSTRITRTTSPGNFGIAGMAVEAMQNGCYIDFKVKPKEGERQNFDLVKVYFEGALANENINVSNALLTEQGRGYAIFKPLNPVDSFRLTMNGDSVKSRMLFYGAELINSHSKFRYHAAGVNGASVSSYLLVENINEQVSAINPQVVVVSLGTNDAFSSAFNAITFASNLKLLIERISAAVPNALIILTTPSDHFLQKRFSNPMLEQARNEIYNVAYDTGCGVWDFYGVMGGESSMSYWARFGLSAPDMLHLNGKGYRLKGALLFMAMASLTEYGFDKPITITD
jgi:lysophospholipase L1-like esterase